MSPSAELGVGCSQAAWGPRGESGPQSAPSSQPGSTRGPHCTLMRSSGDTGAAAPCPPLPGGSLHTEGAGAPGSHRPDRPGEAGGRVSARTDGRTDGSPGLRPPRTPRAVDTTGGRVTQSWCPERRLRWKNLHETMTSCEQPGRKLGSRGRRGKAGGPTPRLPRRERERKGESRSPRSRHSRGGKLGNPHGGSHPANESKTPAPRPSVRAGVPRKARPRPVELGGTRGAGTKRGRARAPAPSNFGGRPAAAAR